MASFKTKQQQSLEDLQITRDEINQLGEALKKEEFRKLLHDYVDEITDPENQKVFEKEITELERERGNDVTFIHPSPGYVIKTSIDGEKKAFINICHNECIGKPTAVPDAGGLHWSIPYSQAQPRDDLDKKKNSCLVFDVVFHPDTIRMAQESNKFKEMVSDTAMNAVESNFKVTLDRKNVRYPKMSFKGFKHPSVIRRKSKNRNHSLSEDSDQGVFEIPNYPYPPINEDNSPKQTKFVSKPISDYTTPKYILKQRRNVDIQECTNSMTSKINAAIPDELVVEVELPLIKSASNVTLDVTEKSLKLVSDKPAKYKLDITLPYAVDEDKGNAKFDSRTKKLTVTLVVKRHKHAPVLCEMGREDSGVDSDIGSGFRSTESSSSEDEPVKGPEELTKSACDERPESEADNSYRTKQSVSFLDSDKHYIFPQFTSNILGNILAFTFHVRNVEPASVESKYLENDSGIHLKFSSLGSGFFPIHYSFCVKFPNNVSVDNENFNVEVWDNNIIAQITLIGCDNEDDIDEYFTGVDENSMKKHILPNPLKLVKAVEPETENSNVSPVSKVKVVKFAEDNVVLEITNSVATSDIGGCCVETNDEQIVGDKEVDVKTDEEENEEGVENVEVIKTHEDTIETEVSAGKVKVEDSQQEKSNDYSSNGSRSTNSPRLKSSSRSLARTLSESHSEKSDMKPPYRGILKVCRSLSESSADDYHWSSSSVENSDPNCSIEKTKKTVRFSDSISKKTFRSNSSILGQRKKNQRKSRNKKRAQERRASESENSEGELDEIKSQEERDFKSDEETSETQSDVSESDDGMKTEKQDVMSLSKRNPHKRGGKKSARKSANTAKMAFTNNLMFDLDM